MRIRNQATNQPARPDLLADIPRGVSSKYLKDQSSPQARWQDQAAILAYAPFHYDPADPRGRLLYGAIGEQLIGVKDDRHTLTVAGNRSGKSLTVIANLLFYDGSVFVIDPKGELAMKTAERRAALGQEVHILDPCGRVTGAAAKYRTTYDPLSPLSADSDSIIEEAMQIVDGLVVSSGQEKDPHWNEAAGAVLLGFILYAKLGSNVPEDKRNMITVRECVRLAKNTREDADGNREYILPNRIMEGIQYLYQNGNEDVAETIEASVYGLYEKSHDEMASVLSTVNRHTAFLDFRSMRRNLRNGSFSLRDLKRNPKGVTIYICLPATRMGVLNRWLRILVNQLIDAMEFETTVPKSPVVAFLDEFPVLGFMKQLQDAIGQVASFHLKLWVIIQDWGQGKALYKDRWESFTANAGVTQFFANTDLATTQYISSKLGKTPVISTRQSETTHGQIDQGLSGKSQSRDLHDLLAPDEVSRVFSRDDPQRRQLVSIAGYHPMILQRVLYFDENAPYARAFEGMHEL